MQYRRLTAHLQTGSADFNRRLAAYLTNHVAMRSALDQAITHSYAQQYPNAPQFPHNQQAMFPSPIMPQNMMQQSEQQSSSPKQQVSHPKPHQQLQQSSHPYRQSPYPTPGTPGYRQHSHARSMSTSHDVPGFIQNFPNSSNKSQGGGILNSGSRSMSMPTPSAASSVTSAEPGKSPSSHPSTSPSSRSKTLPSPSSQSMAPPTTLPYNTNIYRDPSPLTTALPRETQMMLGPAFDVSDPLYSKFMAGSESIPQQFYNFNAQSGISKYHNAFDGFNTTLAPSMLDMSPENSSCTETLPHATNPSALSYYNYGFDNPGDFKGLGFVSGNSSHASGSVTPGDDGGWDAFINDGTWTENAT